MRALFKVIGVATAAVLIAGMLAAPASAGLTLHLRLPYVEAHPGEDLIPDADEYGMDYNGFVPPGTYTRALGAPEYVTNDPAAEVTRDLDGAGNGGAVAVTGPGQVINLQLWAVITDGGPGDDALKKLYASVLSSAVRDDVGVHNYVPPNAPGPIVGNLTQTWGLEMEVVVPGLYYQWVENEDLHAGTGSAIGTQQDLDGDGDADLGYINDDDPDSDGDTYSDTIHVYTGEGGGVFGKLPGAEHLLLDMQLNVSDYSPDYNPSGPSGVTYIWARGRDAVFNIWQVDGTAVSAPPDFGGEPVILYIPSDPDIGATMPGQVVTPDVDLVLDGSAATGSVNWWRWEFDGDPAKAIETDQMVYNATFDELVGVLGLLEGVPHAVTMTVGWVESPPMNVSTNPLEIGFEIVPEPATLALVGLGLAVLARRKRK